jgi:subtilisin family serine protease
VTAGGEPPKPGVEAADLTTRDIRELARDPEVAAIAPVMAIKLVRPLPVSQAAATTAWGLDAVGATDAPFDGTGVDVAVLDTGIDKGHEAFREVQIGERDFSNTLADISAPGVNVLSARAGGGLMAYSGTSMAVPHVAGLAALWWQALRQQPTLVNRALVSGKLLATARTEGFAPGVEIADRGVGIAFAPR